MCLSVWLDRKPCDLIREMEADRQGCMGGISLGRGTRKVESRGE